MSLRLSMEQLRPARTQKVDLVEKVQSLLTEGKAPAGEDWESLIAVAVRKISKKKWNSGPEWDRAKKFWEDGYEEMSMKLGQAFIDKYSINELKQLGASTLATNKQWKGKNKTPKTDLISGGKKISLKKAGGSQLMSAGADEAISTFEAAISMYSIDSKGRQSVNKMMQDVEDYMYGMSSSGYITDLEKLRDSGKELTKDEEDRIEEMEHLQVNADYLNGQLNKVFQDMTFRQYFCWEAATGTVKFKPSPEGIANELAVFDHKKGNIKNNLKLDSANKAGNTIASQNSFYVSFKTGGRKSKPYLALRSRKARKTDFTEQVTFADIVYEELNKSEYGQNLLLESEVQQLDEFQIFNKLASKVRGVSSNIKNKVKQIYVTIMKRVSDAFNYIKSLGKELVEAVMKFLGVEVKNVVVKGSGDFALR